MPSDTSSPVEGRQRSDLSCRSCRRRKVKCDRNLPHCLVCEQTSQVCDYPPGPQKPGPKIGSVQRHRKRSRETDPSNESPRDTTMPRLDANPSVSGLGEDQISTPFVTNMGSPPEDNTLPWTMEAHDGATSTDGRASSPERRIPDLSFILHPAHEVSSPPDKESASGTRQPPGNGENSKAISQACSVLGLSQEALEQLMEIYFDNMTAFCLFHEPSFTQKLSWVSSSTQICALLAAMLAFVVRFLPSEHAEICSGGPRGNIHQRAAHFLELALKYVDESLKECGDLTPPICILQASILTTHCQLTRGVLGKAWRSLGTCCRLAYEMNLHLIDIGGMQDIASADKEQWVENEEKRRAWWAVWEMDVFATTIRRTPTAVDWSQIETLLPVEDEYWFQCKPRPSCFFERDPVYRWKALKNSGNQSPKAWYIVINSLMKDAQRISSPRGVPGLSLANNRHSSHAAYNRDNCQLHGVDARCKLETIANAVECFRLALPDHLEYHNQYLGFDARIKGQYTSRRQEHCSLYNIFMMTQLARLMIHRYDTFGSQFLAAISSLDNDSSSSNPKRSHSQDKQDEKQRLAITQYFEAADNALNMVRRSCDDHVRYINPFLSSTIWLVSAVYLVRSQFCRPGPSKSLIKSRFEVMHLTYKKCVDFWDMQTAVQQNLGTLEEQLESCKQPEKPGHHATKNIQEARRVSPQSRAIHDGHTGIDPSHSHQSLHGHGAVASSPTSQIPHSDVINNNTTTTATDFPQLPPSPPASTAFLAADWPPRGARDVARGTTPNASMLDFMNLLPPQIDARPPPLATLSPLIDQLPFNHLPESHMSLPEDVTHPHPGIDSDPEWRYSWLPSDFHDVLNGLLL